MYGCPKIQPSDFLEDDILDETFSETKPNILCFEQTDIPKRYWGANFTQFPSPFEQKLKDFALGKTDNIFLILQGGNGTGKTYNACSCMGIRMEQGLSCGNFLSCKYTLGPMLRSSKLTTGSRNEFDTYKFYYNSPFVVLDEAGKCDDERLEKAFDSNLFSAAYDNNNRILVTTNFTMDEFCNWLGEDINSRFRQCADVLTLNECDYRKK